MVQTHDAYGRGKNGNSSIPAKMKVQTKAKQSKENAGQHSRRKFAGTRVVLERSKKKNIKQPKMGSFYLRIKHGNHYEPLYLYTLRVIKVICMYISHVGQHYRWLVALSTSAIDMLFTWHDMKYWNILCLSIRRKL